MRTRRFPFSTAFGALALSLVACGGSPGADGKAALTSLAPEPPGPACPAGGMRVLAGADADGDRLLAPNEVTSSQLVCNGSGGAAPASTGPITSVDIEPKGKNCAEGGVAIKSGLDKNANAALEVDEVTDTRFVCNGANGAGSTTGSNPVATAYTQGAIEVKNVTATVQSATLKAPGPGKIIAISNMDAYCESGGTEFVCAQNGPTAGFYTLTLDPQASPATGAYEYFHLQPDATENTGRTSVLDVAAAGDVTVHVRAIAAAGSYGLFRRSLTLMFVPS